MSDERCRFALPTSSVHVVEPLGCRRDGSGRKVPTLAVVTLEVIVLQ